LHRLVPTQAVRWARRAAESGDPRAVVTLASAYLTGVRGSPPASRYFAAAQATAG